MELLIYFIFLIIPYQEGLSLHANEEKQRL